MGVFDAINAVKQKVAEASALAAAQKSTPAKEEKKSAEKKPVDSYEVVSIPLFFGFKVPVVTKSDQNSAGSKTPKQSGPTSYARNGGSEKSADNDPHRLPSWYSWIFESREERLARISRMLRESLQNFRFPQLPENFADFVRNPPDPPAPVCGDGNVDEGEQCDSTPNCDENCNIIPEQPDPFCGDGQVNAPDEQCDGGEQCDAECHTLPPPPPPSVFDQPITLDQMCKVFPQLSGESQFAMGDFNNDGHQDLAVNRPDDGMAYVIMNIQQRCASGQRLSLEAAANIVFSSWELPGGFGSVTAMDMTGDGIKDLLIGSPGSADIGGVGYLIAVGGSGLFNINENEQTIVTPTVDMLNEQGLRQAEMKYLAGLHNVPLGDQLKDLGDVFGNGRDYTSYAAGNNDYCLIAPKDVLNDGSTMKTLNEVVIQVENGEFPAIEFYDFLLNATNMCREVSTPNITSNDYRDFILASDRGRIYFVIGQRNMPSSVDLSNPQGVGVFTITQDNRGDLLGLSTSVYDYTGDGIPDIVLSSPNRSVSVNQNMQGGAGETFVIPGEGIRAALARGDIQPGGNYTISQIIQITSNPAMQVAQSAVLSATQENGQFGRKGIAPVVVGHREVGRDNQNNPITRPIYKMVVAASEYLPPQGNNVTGCLFVYDQGLQGPQWAEQAAVGTIEASDGVQRLGNTLESVDWNGDGEDDGIGVTDDGGVMYFRADTQPAQ
ncbi:MAG TPA: hypothetical protein DDW49_08480 [Deltaproteobacteria bacterium]|nr:MAG: hypothetical protein A2048_05435 [Deltaproteobacteria bacterium GWA2_45_12]HBF13401.1 hypothetical protein [Deltaproteobacteria bacterium]